MCKHFSIENRIQREAANAAFVILDFAAKVQVAADAADGLMKPGEAASGDVEVGTESDAESDDGLYMA